MHIPVISVDLDPTHEFYFNSESNLIKQDLRIHSIIRMFNKDKLSLNSADVQKDRWKT